MGIVEVYRLMRFRRKHLRDAKKENSAIIKRYPNARNRYKPGMKLQTHSDIGFRMSAAWRGRAVKKAPREHPSYWMYEYTEHPSPPASLATRCTGLAERTIGLAKAGLARLRIIKTKAEIKENAAALPDYSSDDPVVAVDRMAGSAEQAREQESEHHAGSHSDVIASGTLLKKKRKALQGYAKRHFELDSNGTLSYSRTKGEKVRDSIDLRKTSIGRSKKSSAWVLDAGVNVPWHIRAVNAGDYAAWNRAFESFAHLRDDNGSVGSPTLEKHTTTKPQQQHTQASTSQTGFFQAGSHMGGTSLERSGSGSSSTGNATTLVPSENGHVITQKSAAELVKLITAMTKTITELEKVSEQGSGQLQYSDPSATTVGRLVSSFTGAAHQVDLQLLTSNVETLKSQHRKLLHFVEQIHVATDQASVHSLERAESIADSEYHDAEGTGAFTYDIDDGEVSSSSSSVAGSGGMPSPAIGSQGQSSDEEEEDTDYEDSEDDHDDFNDASSRLSVSTIQDKQEHARVKRRKQLPHAVAGNEISLFGILKKNMGKDISKISMPISLNEPISQLQAMAEAIQYTELLDHAANTSDSAERLLLVTVFAISTYSPAKYRGSRKPFNPMLGETYELVRPDKGLKFISEKVVHHPNWTACHAQGRGWDYSATASGAQKFWGRSFEFVPEGTSEVRLKKFDQAGKGGELYSWSRVSSFVRNIMSGEKYVEHVGDMVVENKETGERAKVSFKEGSSWGGAGSRNKVEGRLYDADGNVTIEIQGKWDESISRKTGPKSSEIVWQIADFPKDAPRYYGFSEWTIQLNEITPDIEEYLPPTDTRFRVDQRCFEEGKVDQAENYKKMLEEKQRARRSRWEKAGPGEGPPQFFQKAEDGVWRYAGGYWEKREQKDWNRDIQIFETD